MAGSPQFPSLFLFKISCGALCWLRTLVITLFQALIAISVNRSWKEQLCPPRWKSKHVWHHTATTGTPEKCADTPNECLIPCFFRLVPRESFSVLLKPFKKVSIQHMVVPSMHWTEGDTQRGVHRNKWSKLGSIDEGNSYSGRGCNTLFRKSINV